MLRVVEPVLDNRLEFFRGIARVRNHHKFQQALLTQGRDRLHIVVEHRLERLALSPFGMLRRERIDPIKGEKPLEIKRLLTPERPVVVEGSDTVRFGDEVQPAFLCHARDEIENGLLRCAVVPRRQRVG